MDSTNIMLSEKNKGEYTIGFNLHRVLEHMKLIYAMIEIRCVVYPGVGRALAEKRHEGSFGGDGSALYINRIYIRQVHFQNDHIVHGQPELVNVCELRNNNKILNKLRES